MFNKILFADSIKALYDIWFVGDSFLRSIYPTYQEMVNDSKLNKKSYKPYTLDYYNRKAFYLENDSRRNDSSATLRILNKLIDVLNSNDKLPRYICIIPDSDLIKDLKFYEFGARKNLTNIVNWLMRQCDIYIRRKRLQISEKKPGAVTNGQPTMIYLPMIRRIERFHRESTMAKICSLHPESTK